MNAIIITLVVILVIAVIVGGLYYAGIIPPIGGGTGGGTNNGGGTGGGGTNRVIVIDNPDSNRPGSDIPGFNPILNIASVQECMQRCLNQSNCVAFSYAYSVNQRGNCWLKNAIPERQDLAGFQSGFVRNV